MKAWLEGETADLELLSQLFAEGDLRVVRDGEDYYLTAPDIDNPPPDTEFYKVASARLSELNGLAHLEDPAFRRVRLSGKYSDGDKLHQVISPQPAKLTIRMGRPTMTMLTANGDVIPNPPSRWPGRAKLAQTHAAVGRVFRIAERNEDLDWYDLYKIHEIIRDDIKSDDIGAKGWENKIEKLGWSTKVKDSAFTASADRFDVSGESARHAVTRHAEPPKHTMTLREGRDYIRNLVMRWVDYRNGV